MKKYADVFTEKFVAKSKEYICGDPSDPKTIVGTVIDEASAIYLENVVAKAVIQGAKILLGGKRTGALLEPTVITNVPRNADMVMFESFGPLAPILTFKNIGWMRLHYQIQLHMDYHPELLQKIWII